MQMPFEWLVQLVPPLKTRAFSISSSPSVHPNQVHLTVSIVSWTTPFKRKRHGLCSSWLAGLDPFKRSGTYIKDKIIVLGIGDVVIIIIFFVIRSSHSRLGNSRFPASTSTITTSHSHWTRNWMCTIPSIC